MKAQLLKLDGGNFKFVVPGIGRIWVSKSSFPGGVAPQELDVTALGLVAPAPKAPRPSEALGSKSDDAAGITSAAA